MKTKSWVHWKINEYEPNEGQRSYNTFEHNRRLRYIQCGLRSLVEIELKFTLKSWWNRCLCNRLAEVTKWNQSTKLMMQLRKDGGLTLPFAQIGNINWKLSEAFEA
ncbi:MAG: hypothetical protein ACTS5R_00850 [Candidatus Hodgkinia cicadicola]